MAILQSVKSFMLKIIVCFVIYLGSDDSTSQVTKQHQQLFNEDQDMNLVGGSDMNLAGDDDMNLVDDNNTGERILNYFCAKVLYG